MKLRAGNGRVKLTWTAVNGATGYRIYQFNGSQAVLMADLRRKIYGQLSSYRTQKRYQILLHDDSMPHL